MWETLIQVKRPTWQLIIQECFNKWPLNTNQVQVSLGIQGYWAQSFLPMAVPSMCECICMIWVPNGQIGSLVESTWMGEWYVCCKKLWAVERFQVWTKVFSFFQLVSVSTFYKESWLTCVCLSCSLDVLHQAVMAVDTSPVTTHHIEGKTCTLNWKR